MGTRVRCTPESGFSAVILGGADQAAEVDLALAAATTLLWLSEVFSRTTLYTRFFSFEEALEMNSEKEVFLVAGFVVKNFMLFNLAWSK